MKSLSLQLGAKAIMWIATTAPALGGRLIEAAGPAEFPREAAKETTEPAVIESLDEDEDPANDLELKAEQPEGRQDDLPVADIPAAPPSRWKWSRSLSLGMSADDNVYLSSTHRKSDQMLTMSGDFQIFWGLKEDESYLKLEYAPSGVLFANRAAADAFEQKASLVAQWRTAKLTLRTEADVQTLSGGDVDVGDRADRTLWKVAVQVKHDCSTKTSFEVNLASTRSDYSKYLSSMEWVNSNWIDYQLFPKTRLGAGVTFGYLKPEGGHTQTYQQALVRLSNPLTGKLTLNANGGMEIRQLGDGGGTQTTPVFRLGATYQPTERTEISAEVSRRIYSSASMTGQDFVATGGSATLRQWITNRYLLAVAGGYEDAKYESTNGNSRTSRHDQYFFVRPSLSFSFTKWMKLELYYQYRRNISNVASSTFDSNVTGLQATFTF